MSEVSSFHHSPRRSFADLVTFMGSNVVRKGFRMMLPIGWLACVAGFVSAEPAASLIAEQFATRPLIDYRSLAEGFANPPQDAQMRAWWFWHAGVATPVSITRDLEEMKSHGIGGVILVDNGNDSGPQGALFMSDAWKELVAHALREATRLGIEVSLNIQSGCGDPGNPNVANDNGLKKLVFKQVKVSGPGKLEVKIDQPAPTSIFYQDIAVQAVRKVSDKSGSEVIRNWDIKTYNKQDYNLANFYDEFPDGDRIPAVAPDEVIDLTAHFKDGVLSWEAPAGDWMVIRYGMIPTGKRNDYGTKGYKGGLCYDPIHRNGIMSQWNEVAKPLIDIAKQNGNSLKFLHLDSWEMKLCNWTHRFEDSFKRLRGYDMRPYLPVLAGQVVGSRETSDRFLEDFRLTVGDLAAEENYEVLRDMAHAEGIALHMESAGPHQPPVDGLRTLGINDIPMGEAWARSTTHRVSEEQREQVALAASAGHIYGKRFIAAESPTSVGPVWERSPSQVRNVIDRIFCTGVNRVNWHTYDSSPDEYGLPGIAYFAGTHLNRNVTWWKESKEFIAYINRAQHMMTQGLHVADVLGYLGSRAPQFATLHRLARKDIPAGYSWDMCNADAFLKRVSVSDGRIVLPDGKNYALFALSDDKQMHVSVLRKIEQLVGEGMTLVGNPPKRPFGLEGQPQADVEFASLVQRLWGDADGSSPMVKSYGKGNIYIGQPVSQVLKTLKLGPDLVWQSTDGVDLDYIHYQSADKEVDVYYVVNRWARKGIDDFNYRYIPTLPDRFVNVTCGFRVNGDRIVERWDPVRGTITPVHVVSTKDGYHHLPVALEPEGSAFYVFHKGKPVQRVANITRDGSEMHEGNTPLVSGASTLFVRDGRLETQQQGSYVVTFADGKSVRIDQREPLKPLAIDGPWKVDFLERPNLGNAFSSTYPTLKSWTVSENRDEKYFSGTARYSRAFVLDGTTDRRDRRAYLDLGYVGDIATVRVNGKDAGVLWSPPYIADITNFIQPGENHLEVDVTNLWVNRLVGDQKLPEGERKTSTNVLNSWIGGRLKSPVADNFLRVSGLIGPVEIRFSETHPLKPETP